MRRIPALLVAAAACTAALLAQTVTPTIETWTGAGTSDAFSDSANWADGTAPDASDTTIAVFGEGAPLHSVTLTAPVTLGQLQLQGNLSTPARTSYFFTGDTTLTLHGGLTTDFSAPNATFDDLLDIVLAADQTFALQSGYVDINGVVSGTGKLTVATADGTGYGVLALSSANTFSGGVALLSSYLQISGLSALGTGPVTIGTTINGYTPTLEAIGTTTVSNAITLTSSVNVAPDANDANLFTFTGPLTLAGDVWLYNYKEATVYLAGNIGEDSTGTPRSLQIGSGAFVLEGANTYTGGTQLGHRSAAAFTDSQAVPASGVITGTSTSYVGIGFGGTTATTTETTTTAAATEPAYQSALVARLDPTGFLGTLGFDTDPTGNLPDTNYAGVDLSGFANNSMIRLGSLTRALLSGTIKLADGQDYRFGGGGGTLNVSASLFDQPLNTDTSGAPSVRALEFASPSYDAALTLSLNGTNTFTGGISIQDSVLIIDGASALPASGSVALNHGYFGFTENYTPGLTAQGIADFFNRATSYTGESVFGFDSVNRNTPRTISDAIDLSTTISNGATAGAKVYLGTATKVILDGTLAPTTGSSLYLTGVKEGHLIVNSSLSDPVSTSSTETLSVVIGMSSLIGDQDGTVELNGANSYTGGTTLQSGTLLVGNDSALGTAELIVRGSDDPALASSKTDGDVTLANDINLYGDYHYGLELGHEGNANALTLNGVITGGDVTKVGPATFTLGGDNTLHSLTLSAGGLVFTHDHAALTSGGAGSFEMGDGTIAEFTTAAPTLNSLSGGGTLNLAADSILTLDIPTTTRIVSQTDAITTTVISTTETSESEIYNDKYWGTVNGTGASLVKTGDGTLALSGANTYTAGTTISAGTLVAQSSSALGTGTVTVNGGALGLDHGVTLSNSLTFNAGTLMGYGTFASPNGITVGAGQALSPGNGVGKLAFATDLTFAASGTLNLELGGPIGVPGTDWDLISVSTQLAITATTEMPFVINLIAGDSPSGTDTDADVIYGHTYTFTFAQAAGGITGFTSTDQFVFNASQLFAQTGIADALISVSLDDATNSLVLNFTPVPEPSTYALMALGLGIVGVAAYRRRRS